MTARRIALLLVVLATALVATLATRSPSPTPLAEPGTTESGRVAEAPQPIGSAESGRLERAPGSGSRAARGAESQDFAAERRRQRVSGRVVDRTTREPVRDAVVATDDTGADGKPAPGVHTDADGRFALEVRAERPTGMLRVRHPQFADAAQAVALDAALAAPVEIGLEPGGTIEGEIVGVAASIKLGSRVTLAHAPDNRRFSVDLDGLRSFQFSGVPAGDYEARLDVLRSDPEDAAGYVAAEVNLHLDGGATRSVTLATERGCGLNVRVLSKGKPVDDARVYDSHPSAPFVVQESAQEGNGTYALRRIKAGRSEVKVNRLTAATTRQFVDLVAGETASIIVELPASGVRGRVRISGAAEPPSHVFLELFPKDRRSDSLDVTWTEPDGSYTFEDIPPGAYVVVVEAPSSVSGHKYDALTVPSVRTAESEVDVRDGETATLDLTVERAAGLRVRVNDPAGKPYVHAVVILVPFGEATTPDARWDRWFQSGGETDEDGSVRLRGIADGRYVVHVDQSEFDNTVSAPVSLVAGVDSEIAIGLRAAPRARLLLDVVVPDGSNAPRSAYALLDANGAEIDREIPHADLGHGDGLAIVPFGRYELRVVGSKWVPTVRTIDVKDSRPQTIHLELEPRSP